MREHYFVEKEDKGYLIERKRKDGQIVDEVELVTPMNNYNPSPSPSPTPGKDSVGTDEIKNGSILIEDVNPSQFATNRDIDEIFNN